jgi:membrane AbrB-like protein
MTALLCVTVLGLLGGAAGHFSGLPGGVMAGTLLAVAAGNLAGLPANRLPRGTTFCGQVLAGIMLGVQMTMDKLLALANVLPPLLIIMAILLVTGFISSLLLNRVFGWDLITAWLSSSPGRMQDMVIIAAGLDARSERVAITHIVRIALVVMATPVILSFWTG